MSGKLFSFAAQNFVFRFSVRTSIFMEPSNSISNVLFVFSNDGIFSRPTLQPSISNALKLKLKTRGSASGKARPPGNLVAPVPDDLLAPAPAKKAGSRGWLRTSAYRGQ